MPVIRLLISVLSVSFLVIFVLSAFPAKEVNAQTCYGNGLADGVIDHQDVCLFDRLRNNPSDNWAVEAAKNLHSIFRHASQGNNLRLAGIQCLYDPSPNVCRRFPEGYHYLIDDAAHSKFSYSNMIFEFNNTLPRQNDGWDARVQHIQERLNGDFDNLEQGDGRTYIPINHLNPHFIAFKFAYVDFSDRLILCFTRPGECISQHLESTLDSLMTFDDPYPNTQIYLWTSGLAISMPPNHHIEEYQNQRDLNNEIRQQARQHGIPLFDYADILSHRYAGYPPYDPQNDIPPRNRDYELDADFQNEQCIYVVSGTPYPNLCIDYPGDVGHLYSLGALAPAKAYWVLMASLAGWNPGGTTPPPTPTNTPLPTSTNTPVPTATPIPIAGDIDGDGDVDIFDFNVLVSNYGWEGIIGDNDADINPPPQGDGKVDIFDFNLLISNYTG